MAQGPAAIVIDNGSHTCKSGFAGDYQPRSILTTVIGKPRSKFLPVGMGVKACYVGKEATSKRGVLGGLVYPIQRGEITDWDCMEDMWRHIFDNELKISSEDFPVLMTEPSLNPSVNRERTVQTMFETFKVPAFHLYNQAVLALYNYGKSSGTVVDSGHAMTHIVPIHDGTALTKNIRTTAIAGSDLIKFLQEILTQKGYSFDAVKDFDILNDIKERLCYTSTNFEKEMNPATESSDIARTYQLPDCNVVTLDNERFRCGELLFQPSCVNSETPGIHQSLFESISGCDVAFQKSLYSNIFLAGGSALLSGMPERLLREVKELVPPFTEVKVKAPKDRKYAAWTGGSILASLSTFQKMWISIEEYNDVGPAIIQRKGLGSEANEIT